MNKRYKAFISYAHSDESWAKWLQNSLERFTIPRNLIQQTPAARSLSSRLYPIFRDRDELASSADISECITSALEDSDALIVICSPAAARSKWVNQEIRYFQAADRSNKIFCLLVDGSPDQSDLDCAFPAALLVDANDAPLPEPLAAEVGTSRTDRRAALLMIVAALLGVGVDDLKQRDAQRQLRFRGAVATVSIAVAAITVVFALLAQVARDESEIRRAQAEGLISFMLEDLRSRLEPVGRLDILDAVGNEAMEYFSVLGDRGTEQEVFARAMALRQIGEVRFRQGALSAAQEAFEESRNVTRALSSSAPGNSTYLFELGQAEFWVGYAAQEQSRLEQAQVSFSNYMELTQQLLSSDPNNADFQLELIYALGNLGSVSIDSGNMEQALLYFQQSITLNENLVDAAPDDLSLRFELGGGYSWLGATQLQLGALAQSEAAYEAAVEELAPAHESGEDRIYSQHYGENNYHLGNLYLNQGMIGEARSRFDVALTVFEELVDLDPENAIWRADRGITAFYLAELFASTGRDSEALVHLPRAIADFNESVSIDPGDIRIQEFLSLAENLMADLTIENAPAQAMALSRQANERLRGLISSETVKPRTNLNATIVMEGHGDHLRRIGDSSAALATWKQALDLLSAQETGGLTRIAVEKQLLVHLQGIQAGDQLANKLSSSGFRDPRY